MVMQCPMSCLAFYTYWEEISETSPSCLFPVYIITYNKYHQKDEHAVIEIQELKLSIQHDGIEHGHEHGDNFKILSLLRVTGGIKR
ncbi:hypothetical protein KM043_008867 [Ampulex compressa]|nr:hypothetical protein KM043_008867 [Ampulex compressa]